MFSNSLIKTIGLCYIFTLIFGVLSQEVVNPNQEIPPKTVNLNIPLFVKMRLETKNLTEFTHTDMDLSVLTGMVRVILDRKIYKNGTVVGPVRVYLFGVGIS
ncbi:uncharacterized protein LOC112538686 [Tetranychus urticae]|uniref:uncharacterized protein LOC112538686 n=1 Tax=Tetranychus urticae TaxID=32264 RepID=UPI000D643949|nr:uncharacterized protein LOC112538686 [Tetranychus urticae]